MIRHRSIRFRLALWYTAMLFVALAMLAPILWVGVSYSMTVAVDERLDDRLDAVVKPLGEFFGDMGDRIRAIASNPDLAATVLPEFHQGLKELRSGVGRDEFARRVVTHIIGEHFQKMAAALPEGEAFEILNPQGVAIASRLPDGPFPWPEVVATGSPVRESTEAHDEQYRVLIQTFEVNGEVYELRTATSLEPIQATRHRMGRFTPWVLLSFLLMATLGGWAISTRALRPVDQITSTAKSISIADLSHRLEVPKTGDELERLASTWNGMLARLEGAVARLGQFTADASHELRTPTAVIRTTAELALRRERSPEEYRQALDKIMTEAGRMTRLVEDLLTLARADSNLETLPLTDTDLRAVVRDVCQDQKMLAEARSLRLDWTLPANEVAIEGNPEALRRLLILLLDNAVKYTPAGGEITVAVINGDGSPEVAVRDSGVGIPTDALPHIFDRFYRADRSRSRGAGSFGLGLSVARWIADRHRATIDVESIEGQGSLFRVRFPRLTADRTTFQKETKR